MTYSGTMINDLIDTSADVYDFLQICELNEAIRKAKLYQEDYTWHAKYFSTGELILDPWELMVHVRNSLIAGANNDGVMSPGAAGAWFDLSELQRELVMEMPVERPYSVSEHAFEHSEHVMGRGNVNG